MFSERQADVWERSGGCQFWGKRKETKKSGMTTSIFLNLKPIRGSPFPIQCPTVKCHFRKKYLHCSFLHQRHHHHSTGTKHVKIIIFSKWIASLIFRPPQPPDVSFDFSQGLFTIHPPIYEKKLHLAVRLVFCIWSICTYHFEYRTIETIIAGNIRFTVTVSCWVHKRRKVSKLS